MNILQSQYDCDSVSITEFGRTQDIDRAILSRAGCRCLLIWHQQHVAVASEQCLQTTAKALTFLEKWLHQPSPNLCIHKSSLCKCWSMKFFLVVLGPQRLEGFGMIQRSTFPRLWCLHSVSWAPLLIADCLHKAWARTGWLQSPSGRSICVSSKWLNHIRWRCCEIGNISNCMIGS